MENNENSINISDNFSPNNLNLKNKNHEEKLLINKDSKSTKM